MLRQTHQRQPRTRRIVAALFTFLVAVLSAQALLAASAAQGSAVQATAGRQLFLPLIGAAGATAPAPSETGLSVALSVTPVSQVAPGDVIRATLTARNTGPEALSFRNVVLRFQYDQLAYEQTELDPAQAVLFSYGGDNISLTFRRLEPNIPVAVTVLLRVRSTLAAGTTIALEPEYFCGAALCFGNRAEVQVSLSDPGLESADGTEELAVAPATGTRNTVFRFASRKFPARDTVELWVGSADGVQLLPQRYVIGPDGWLRFELTGADLGVGSWNILAHGSLSGYSSVANVTVANTDVLPITAAPAGTPPPPAQATTTTQSAPTQAGGAGGVSGRVTAAAGGAGVADVLVLAIPNDGDGAPAASTRTGSDGRYLIPVGLASGSYTVRFLAASAGSSNLRDAVYPQPVIVAEPELTRNIDATLSAGGVISGRITASDTGAGLPGVTVTVRDDAAAPVASGATDANGAYTVVGLTAGTYTLAIQPATGDDGSVVAYAPATLAGVTVAAGTTTSRDASLNLRAEIAKLRGRVLGTAGPLADVFVAVFDSEHELVDLTRSAADGRYATGPLANGSYRVAFITSFAGNPTTKRYVSAYYGGATADAATLVNIAGPGVVPDIDATLALGGQLAGRVSGSDAPALADVLVAAFDGEGAVRALARTDANGAYDLAGLAAGAYQVGFFAEYAADPAVRQYQDRFYNGQDSLAAAASVIVTAGATTPNINETLALGGRIAGRVSAVDDGSGLEGVVVIVLTADATIAAVTTTDSAGAYATPGLAPDSYTVLFDTILAPVAATRGYLDEYFDNRRDAPYTPVTVAAGAASTANAALTRGGQIAGRVTAADTDLGLSGVIVLVFANETLAGIAVTDAGGAYLTSALPAGNYTLQFDPTISAHQETEQYAPASRSDPVSVTVGAVTPGIDVTMSRP
jgi:hypothetical protein